MIWGQLRLRTLLPLLVALVILPFGCLVIFVVYLDANQQLLDTRTKSFERTMASLSVEIEAHLRRGELTEVKHILSIQGVDEHLSHICLVQNEGIILMSTRYEWEGFQASDVIEHFDAQAALEITSHKQKSIFQHDEATHTIFAYRRVQMRHSGLLRDQETAVLISAYHYAPQYHALQNTLFKQLSFFAIGLILFSLLLVYLLRHWVQKPLNQLLAFVDDIEHGNYGKSINIDAGSELNQLARKLSTMSKQLGQSQDKLIEAHTLMVNLIDSVPDLIFYKTKSGTFLGCNQAFCSLVGLSSPAEVVGKTDFELFDYDTANFHQSQDQTMFASGKALRYEQTMSFADGSKILMDILKTPYLDKDGQVIGMIGVARDITAFKDLEEQFLQAQKMEAVGTLVGGIAHDFNNMLAGISGNLYLSKKKLHPVDDAYVYNKIESMESLANHAASIIKQLLTFARKGQVTMHQIVLPPLIHGALSLLRSSVPENILIEENITNEPLNILGDDTLIHQILMNLINNAHHALDGKTHPVIGVTLQATTLDEDFVAAHVGGKAGRYAQLSISDNGIGIDTKHLDRVFEPFFTTKSQGQGTGLGLAMVFGAVQSHSGLISVESELGLGTTFDIYFPILEPQQSPIPQLPTKRSSSTRVATILLVDDDAMVRETVAEALETQGYIVVQAENGQLAMNLFDVYQDTISVAVLDAVMPVCGGSKVADYIHQSFPDFPIVFMTGYDKDRVLADQKHHSNTVILNKPTPLDELMMTIEQLI